MKCRIKDCNKDVASETSKNYRKSKDFCEEHAQNGVIIKCVKCGKELKTRACLYKENYNCRSCVLTERNKSEYMRKSASERIIKLNSDPEFKKQRRERMIKYNKEHKEELIERGKLLGSTIGRENLLKFIGSDKQKKHLIKLNTSDRQKESVSKLLIERWKDPKQRKLMMSGFNNEHRKALLKVFNSKFESLEHINGKCRKCNEETIITKDFQWCKDCKPHGNIDGGKFDREKFYQSKLDKVNFNYIDKQISLEDIDSLKGIPGVWCKSYIDENKKEICLDVCQTKDIGKEMLWSIRVFDSNANKSDNELKHDNQFSLRKKYRNMYNDCKGNIIYKVLAINIQDQVDRELIEMQYAYETQAKYWSPAPGQNLR